MEAPADTDRSCDTRSSDTRSEIGSSSARDNPKRGTFKIVFIGTGVSTAVPNLGHILADSCDVCRDAHLRPGSKNKRSNVSIAIIFESERETGITDSEKRITDSGKRIIDSERRKEKIIDSEKRKEKCVLIDVGKTMREACLAVLPKHGIKEVAAIVLTHGHADAILGLDDVRDLQVSKAISIDNPAAIATSLDCLCCIQDMQTCQLCADSALESSALESSALESKLTGFQVVSGAMPVYLHQETMDVVSKTFAYLTQAPEYIDENIFLLSRRIALLKFTIIEQDDTFSVCGLPIRSFPVYHGGKYVSLGFSIGKEGQFVYISDVKIIPESTMAYLRSIPRIDTLVVDALNRDGIWSHMGLEEGIALVQELQPLTAYFTGMSCQMGMHDEMEGELKRRAPHTYLAYDGLVLDGFDI